VIRKKFRITPDRFAFAVLRYTRFASVFDLGCTLLSNGSQSSAIAAALSEDF
jgi:hypothetical protein